MTRVSLRPEFFFFYYYFFVSALFLLCFFENHGFINKPAMSSCPCHMSPFFQYQVASILPEIMLGVGVYYGQLFDLV